MYGFALILRHRFKEDARSPMPDHGCLASVARGRASVSDVSGR
jgi:hypothetical protein